MAHRVSSIFEHLDQETLRQLYETEGSRRTAKRLHVSESGLRGYATRQGWQPGLLRPGWNLKAGQKTNLKHGAKSDEKVEEKVKQMAEDFDSVLDSAPWLREPCYRHAVEAWKRAEARVTLIEDWLEENGIFDDQGHLRGTLSVLAKMESAAARARSQLGLDPESRLKLMRQIAETSHLVDLGVDGLDESGRSSFRQQATTLRDAKQSLDEARREVRRLTASSAMAVSAGA